MCVWRVWQHPMTLIQVHTLLLEKVRLGCWVRRGLKWSWNCNKLQPSLKESFWCSTSQTHQPVQLGWQWSAAFPERHLPGWLPSAFPLFHSSQVWEVMMPLMCCERVKCSTSQIFEKSAWCFTPYIYTVLLCINAGRLTLRCGEVLASGAWQQ